MYNNYVLFKTFRIVCEVITPKQQLFKLWGIIFGMERQIGNVEQFHKKFSVPIGKSPSLIFRERTALRYSLMREELEEYRQACEEEDLVEIVDALGDLLYVTFGTIIEHGLQDIIGDVFEEIQRSNMSKLGRDGKPIYREDGKVIKGPDFFKPNIGKFLKPT